MELNEALQLLYEASANQLITYLQNAVKMARDNQAVQALQRVNQMSGRDNTVKLTGKYSSSDKGAIDSLTNELGEWIKNNPKVVEQAGQKLKSTDVPQPARSAKLTLDNLREAVDLAKLNLVKDQEVTNRDLDNPPQGPSKGPSKGPNKGGGGTRNTIPSTRPNTTTGI